MSIKKKIVFLPYDFDTAIGINNEGSLVFSYNLEDIDQTQGGADIFNGQQSVLWKNLRDAFVSDIKSMYQSLRSSGAISYQRIETAFEEHQAKWPEAIFNEDAWFKYLAPLEEKGSAAYLSMLQGSKAEQRKWWLYNRFKYIDSKYNAGDSLTDVITLRGYAKANISITPYADVYATVKFGSYLVQTRAARNQTYEMVCPLDNVNDTEIYIYSASQLANVGDLSGLKVGYAEFVYATKLQNLKLGDSNSSYENGNLQTLYLGNNGLLKVLDVRNCTGLGTGDQKTVDISGCVGIEEVYFDGTNITGLTLPNGGVLETLHLPATITSLIIRNQPNLTEFVCPSFSNISTLWLENTGTTVNTLTILNALTNGARVRLFGFLWTAQNASEIDNILDKLDAMRGLDQNGNNMATAQVYGTIHVPSITGSTVSHVQERYADITLTYDHVTSTLTYKDNDGTLLGTETIYDNSTPANTPSMTNKEDGRYYYTFTGWTSTAGGVADSNIFNDLTADKTVYAAYSVTEKTFTVRFYNGSTLLQTYTNVPYGADVEYETNPTYNGVGNANDYIFNGWYPMPENITEDTDCIAQYQFVGMYFRQYLTDTMNFYEDTNSLTTVGNYAFAGLTNLQSISMPSLTAVPQYGFAGATNLETVSLPSVLATNENAFTYNSAMEVLRLPELTLLNAAPLVQDMSALKELQLPKNTSSLLTMIISCQNLELLDAGVTTTIGINLNSTYFKKMKYMVLRNTTTVATPYGSTIFSSASPLGAGEGLILVPSSMVASYKADSAWGAYSAAIESIESHPEICS